MFTLQQHLPNAFCFEWNVHTCVLPSPHVNFKSTLRSFCFILSITVQHLTNEGRIFLSHLLAVGARLPKIPCSASLALFSAFFFFSFFARYLDICMQNPHSNNRTITPPTEPIITSRYGNCEQEAVLVSPSLQVSFNKVLNGD